MEEFKENIRLYLKYDDEIKQLNSKLSDLRASRTNTISNIYSVVNDNPSLRTSTINLKNNKKLQFTTRNSYQSISMKLVESALQEYFDGNEEEVSNVMSIIKKQRKVVEVNEIKIV